MKHREREELAPLTQKKDRVSIQTQAEHEFTKGLIDTYGMNVHTGASRIWIRRVFPKKVQREPSKQK